MGARISVAFLVAAFAMGGFLPRIAAAEERTVVGTIVRLDPAGGEIVVRDAAGASWSYKVDADAGIDLSGFRQGDRVKVSIGRATPLNMITAADRLRKGDRVEKAPYSPVGQRNPKGDGSVSKWVILCPECGEEFKIDVEEIPERCPLCKHEGSFEVVDVDD